MATCYKVTAPKSMGKIPKGFSMQVVSSSSFVPERSEIERALKAAGFTEISEWSWASPGNWEIMKL